jgi:peptidoglycan hydrolase CwlO-like protein
MKLDQLNETINRLLKGVNYSFEVKEEIKKSLEESPSDIKLREEVLKILKKKIAEENKHFGRRVFKTHLVGKERKYRV